MLAQEGIAIAIDPKRVLQQALDRTECIDLCTQNQSVSDTLPQLQPALVPPERIRKYINDENSDRWVWLRSVLLLVKKSGLSDQLRVVQDARWVGIL